MATARQTQRQRQHSDVPENFWHREMEPLSFGRENFKITALRRGRPELSLDSQAEAFNWAENDSHVLSGAVTLALPPLGDFRNYRLNVGDVVRCQVGTQGQETLRELWRLRVSAPSYQIASHVYQWQLVDDLDRLGRTKGDFKYRKDKSHPQGWRGDEIIADVSKRFGFVVARLPRLHHRFKNLTRTNASPLEILGIVLRTERISSGTRFFMRYAAGRLAIQPYQRSEEILVMSGTLIDGTLTESLPDTYVNVLHVDGKKVRSHKRDKHGRRGERQDHIHITLTNKDGVNTYGAVARRVKAPSYVDSQSELHRYAAHILARDSKPSRTLEFTHPGVPSVKRGDALRITIPEASVDREIVYVHDVQHNVGQSNDYQMDITVQFDDPFVKALDTADYVKRQAVAKREHRKLAHETKGDAQSRARQPREKQATKHGDATGSRHNRGGLVN